MVGADDPEDEHFFNGLRPRVDRLAQKAFEQRKLAWVAQMENNLGPMLRAEGLDSELTDYERSALGRLRTYRFYPGLPDEMRQEALATIKAIRTSGANQFVAAVRSELDRTGHHAPNDYSQDADYAAAQWNNGYPTASVEAVAAEIVKRRRRSGFYFTEP